nr:PREDICTED: uncharacterized protein DDB_G0283697-like [Linepithema humile]
MKSRARVLVLLFCVARASIVLPSKEITELKAAHVQDLSNISIQETNGTDEQAADKLRDKRALGLLLSGLAQIFGYTVTPIQIATLPNPNTTIPAAMSAIRPQVASSQSTPVPKQRETIRFTGVLNFGNNSDILGHLQRYEQIFHAPRNNMTIMTTLSPPPKPTPPAHAVTLNPRINSPTRPPLLAPFFVKIPLPIAPELLPATIPEDLTLSYPAPAVTVVSDSNAEPPTRKQQQTVYKNNGDNERYTLEQKEIYNEKDVRKPVSKNTHQLFVDEPSGNKQQRNREKPAHCRDDETKERYKDREEEIDNRNRQHASKYKPTKNKRPTHDDEKDEDSAERYEEHEDEPKSARGSSRQPPEKTDKDKVEDYPDGSDERDKQSHPQAENFDKYIETGYNQQLPIGDYFHEGNPEMIRDSYGEVLDGKRLENDKLAEYINMFKHPYTGVYASQEVRDPEDASEEDGKKALSADGYNEHLARLQKLREEYSPPENKYEEYDINDERKADRNDKRSERNRASARSKRPKTGKVLQNDDVTLSGAQQEIDFGKYTPLIVPVRYIDVNDKVEQATTQQLNYKEVNKSIIDKFSENKMESTVRPSLSLPLREKLPQQLHESEFHKQKLQVSPPFFDYAYDNTQPANVIIPANPEKYPRNYQYIAKNNGGHDANNDKSSEERYLVVVSNPTYQYQYPQNIYYTNEATNPPNQASHLNTEGTHPQDQIYVPQQSGNQQFIQANPNLNLNETAKNSYNYYYQPQEIPANVLDRYRYIFGEQAQASSQTEESFIDIDMKSQIPNAENWSNRIYRPQSRSDARAPFLSPPQLQLQNVAASNTQGKPLERPPSTQRIQQRSRLNSKPEKQRRNDEKTEIPQESIPKNFNDPQTAHDFFGFSKDDYSFRDESNEESKVAEENGRAAKESHVLVVSEPVTDHYDESIEKYADELENDPEKAKVKEYRNRVATLRVSEQRQASPNGPIHYVDFIRNI